MGRKSIGALLVAAALANSAPVSAQAGSDVTDVPLRVIGGKLVVPVDIGEGFEGSFIVSTGNAVTVLSQAFVDNHGTDGEFWLGDVPVDLDGAATIPDAQLALDGEMIVGIIGSNTLNRYDILIDVPESRMLLKSAKREVSWDGVSLSEPVRLRVYHGVVLGLDVDVGDRSYPAMLDIGTSAIVANGAVGTSIGIDSKGVASLGLGQATLVELPFSIQESSLLDRWDPDGNGFVIVGAPIAYDCAVSISWIHREMRTCAR